MIEEAQSPQEGRERHEWAVEREEERLQLLAHIQDLNAILAIGRCQSMHGGGVGCVQLLEP